MGFNILLEKKFQGLFELNLKSLEENSIIIGHGIDVCDVAKIAADLENIQRYSEENWSPSEIEYCDKVRGVVRARRYAVRFAGKETVIKTLGGGGDRLVNMRQISIERNSCGKPSVALSGETESRARELGISDFHISMSHLGMIAIASCIAVAKPHSA